MPFEGLPIINTSPIQPGVAQLVGKGEVHAAAGSPTQRMRPVSTTLPPPPNTEGASPTRGVQSMGEGLARTTRAEVDVARRGFWRHALGATLGLVSVGLMAAAMAAATAVAAPLVLVGFALTAGFAVKSACSAALSWMNWRNAKAEMTGRPVPYPSVQNLPPAVRQDAMAALMVRLGASEKLALRTSLAVDLTLVMGSAACLGWAAGGVGGAALALTPLVVTIGAQIGTAHLEARRQAHAQQTEQSMQGIANDTLANLQGLQELNGQLLPILARTTGDAPDEARKLHEQALELHQTGLQLHAELREQLLERVAKKVEVGTLGVSAVALDAGTEKVSIVADTVVGTPVSAIWMGAVVGRTALEWGRTVRSERRDTAKLAQFDQAHRDLQGQLRELTSKLKEQVAQLNSPGAKRNDKSEPPLDGLAHNFA